MIRIVFFGGLIENSAAWLSPINNNLGLLLEGLLTRHLSSLKFAALLKPLVRKQIRLAFPNCAKPSSDETICMKPIHC